jgi:hypothetical protein
MNPIPAGKERVGMMDCSNNNIENVHKQTALPLPSPSPSPSLSSSPSPTPTPSRYALPHPIDVISNRNSQDTHHEHCKRTCLDLENSKKACIDLGHCNKKTCVDSEHHKKKVFVNSEHHNKKTYMDLGEHYKKAHAGMEPYCNEKTYVDPMVVTDDVLSIDKDLRWYPKPLPHPEVITNVVRELKSFSLESIALACQQFSLENLVGDDTHSFYGVDLGLRGKKQRSVVISQFNRSLQMVSLP